MVNYRFGLLDELLDEVIMDTFGDEDSSGRNAVLALVEEHLDLINSRINSEGIIFGYANFQIILTYGSAGLFDGLLQVSVGEDDQRRLATQFKRHLLDVRFGAAKRDFCKFRRIYYIHLDCRYLSNFFSAGPSYKSHQYI